MYYIDCGMYLYVNQVNDYKRVIKFFECKCWNMSSNIEVF